MIYGLAAGPDPAGMSCAAIIKGYEKNTLLASPEGGRSAKHRKNSAVRVKELQPFYDQCVGGGEAPQAHADAAKEDQAVIDAVYGGGRPATMAVGVARPVAPAGMSTATWIALGVGGALVLTFLLTRRK